MLRQRAASSSKPVNERKTSTAQCLMQKKKRIPTNAAVFHISERATKSKNETFVNAKREGKLILNNDCEVESVGSDWD